ncbi:ferrous iron transport protein B [Methanomicrobium sp. W14]|uniref:FeoB small GTPase domain-containing protein n=1 Tax=Methanomicrobium sp. W14 TaxID=2817839 RepID=UPI001AE5F7C6|nr:FeoB small GTPase domain-containing protein [Methanomicrobium sp. W14]MBP2133303.1 ferrous iron transport protein B [Methanomicrobium sp. W14]
MEKENDTILLIGNPNVGKSVLFNRLTGGNAVVSNYPGTTVDFTKGSVVIDKKTYEVIDVPGAYSLEPRDKAEEVCVKMIEKHRNAIAVIVLDATRIERGLYIALETIEKGLKSIVVLNMMDSAREKEISIDNVKLQKILGVPVVETSAIAGEGLKQLGDMIRKAQYAEIKDIKLRSEGKETKPATSPGCAGCGGCGGCGGA